MSLRTLLTGIRLPQLATAMMLLLLAAAPAHAELLADEDDEDRGDPVQEGLHPPAAVGARTGLLALFPGLYGNLEIRHWTQREMDQDTGPGRLTSGPKIFNSDHAVNDQPFLALRPQIGSTFDDGALDTVFIYQFQNNTGDSRIQKTDAYNFTIWNLLRGKFNPDSPWSFGPSAYTDFFSGDNNGSDFAYSDIGVFGEANYQFPIATGALSLRSYLNPAVEFNSPEHNGTIKSGIGSSDVGADRTGGGSNANSSALVETPKGAPAAPPTVHPHNPLVLAYYGLGVTYLPAAVKGFTVMGGIDFIEAWKPIYDVSTSDTGVHSQLDHYSVQALSFNRIILTYQLTDRVTITDQARHYLAGFFASSINSAHPEQTGQENKISWEKPPQFDHYPFLIGLAADELKAVREKAQLLPCGFLDGNAQKCHQAKRMVMRSTMPMG